MIVLLTAPQNMTTEQISAMLALYANLLHTEGRAKKYIGIAKALFAYAVSVSIENGYDGVLVFKAKTSELVEYYIREFGASRAGSYDPFRLVIWEDAAQMLIKDFERSD